MKEIYDHPHSVVLTSLLSCSSVYDITPRYFPDRTRYRRDYDNIYTFFASEMLAYSEDNIVYGRAAVSFVADLRLGAIPTCHATNLQHAEFGNDDHLRSLP